MAGELPQFKDEQPILNAQNVNSRAAGFEAFAKAFGNLADQSMDKVKQIEVEKSNAMLMQSSNLSEQLKTNTQIQMIQNPAQAQQIAQVAAQTNDSIKKSAFVNKDDRLKLNYMIDQNQNQLNLKAAETSYNQAKRGAAINFWDNYPVTMSQIQNALNSGDMKRAKILEDTLHNTAIAAARAQAISPEQFGTIRKTSYDLYARTEDLMNMAKSGNATAAQYHAAYASPFDSNSFDGMGTPVDGNTQWMASHLNYDRTFAGQLTALYNGTPINWGAVASASDNDYNKFKMAMLGVNQVKGAVRAGVPFNQIEQRISTLESKPNLTAVEDAEVKYWKSYKSRLGTDNGFYGVMGQTVLGQQYTAAHQAEGQAIMSSAKSDAEKAEAMRINDNNYIGKMVDLANSQELSKIQKPLDPHFIKPIASPWVEEVKSSFQKDAPVLPAIQRIAYLNPEYRAYLADSMPKPHQAVAVWVAGSTMGNTDPSFQADLIHANQDTVSPQFMGQDTKEKTPSSLLLSGKDDAKTKPDNVWNDVLNQNDQMKNLYSYFGKLPGGKTAQDGFRQMAVNYVYDQAQRAGDVDLSNKNQYISNFVNNTMKGFNLYRNDKAFVNMNDIQVARTQDVDHLVNYVLSEAYHRIHEGKSESEFLASIDLNPLMVVSTPDRRLVVVDRYGRAAVTNDGHEAFDMPYTSNMLSAATKRSDEVRAYLQNYGGDSSTERFGGGVVETFKDKEGNLNLPTSPQEVMLHQAMLRRDAQQQRENEAALLRAKESRK